MLPASKQFERCIALPHAGGHVAGSCQHHMNLPSAFLTALPACCAVLPQIGDVVLVHDESGLYEQDLDGRLGFVDPVGLGARTRTGEFLGKVNTASHCAPFQAPCLQLWICRVQLVCGGPPWWQPPCLLGIVGSVHTAQHGR